MCYNKESSITAFIVGIVLSTYLFTIGDKYLKTLSIFSGYIVFAQLIEYFLWDNQSCNKTNDIVSKIIPLYLLGQPLSVLLALYYFKSSFVKPEVLMTLIVIGLCIILKILYDTLTSNKKLCSKGVNGSLEWDTIYNPKRKARRDFLSLFTEDGIMPQYSKIFYSATLLFVLFLNNKLYSWISAFLLVSTFLMNFLNNVNWYSTFCFTMVILPLVLIITKFFV
jgi:hypothetical protein